MKNIVEYSTILLITKTQRSMKRKEQGEGEEEKRNRRRGEKGGGVLKEEVEMEGRTGRTALLPQAAWLSSRAMAYRKQSDYSIHWLLLCQQPTWSSFLNPSVSSPRWCIQSWLVSWFSVFFVESTTLCLFLMVLFCINTWLKPVGWGWWF